MQFPLSIVDGPIAPFGGGRADRDGIPTKSISYVKMTDMANLTLVYGMRLLPEGEVKEIHDATLKLANGNEAHVTMHVLEGSREEIENQLKQSLDAFFDFYPEL
ncbi:MAG TPA: hypothetical protein VHZ28_16665 [Terracidiphilus sp.]|jgi:hypothetical protein|nr:hypothetical protein [Terracidiphilus sp.]